MSSDRMSVASENSARAIPITPFPNRSLDLEKILQKPPTSYEARCNRIRSKIADQLDEAVFSKKAEFVVNSQYPEGVYSGEVVDSKREGLGYMVFESTLHDEPREEIETEVVTKHYGYWQNDKPNGFGVLKYDKNHYYRGEFEDGRFCGRGVYVKKNEKYEGKWKNNEKHGKGSEFIGEEMYCGQFEHGKRHGKGTLRLENGEFKGLFAEGKPIHGCYTEKDHTIKYKGFLKRNKWHGKGKLKVLRKNSDISVFHGTFEKGIFKQGSVKIDQDCEFQAKVVRRDNELYLQVIK